jgi:chorismate mutase
MDYLLREQERLQSRVRRYESPDEYPFFPEALEQPILQPLEYPKILHDNDVNVNEIIKKRYVENILPAVCAQFGREDRGEAKENYGSAATCDVSVLQALSRRIHFGKFVAEAKFQKDPALFVKLIKANDRAGIDAAITDAKVEKKVLERLGLKAKTYGTDPAFPSETGPKINVDAVVAMYKVSERVDCIGKRTLLIVETGICHSSDQGGGSRVPHATAERHSMGVNDLSGLTNIYDVLMGVMYLMPSRKEKKL